MLVLATGLADSVLAAARGPRFDVVGGIPYFRNPPKGPPSLRQRRYFGTPAVLPADMGIVITGAGRMSAFGRLAARSWPDGRRFCGVVCSDLEAWHQLSVRNRNPRRLPTIVAYNPVGEPVVHPLPPRNVRDQLAELEGKVALDPARWEPVIDWVREQRKDNRWDEMASDMQRSAQMQAVTTRIAGLETVVGSDFVNGLHSGVAYAFLHATKSLDPAGRIGAEILRDALNQHGRPDLAPRVVSSGGYMTEHEAWMGKKVRLHFSGEDADAVVMAQRSVGGDKGRDGIVENEWVRIVAEMGWEAVVKAQLGGVFKNIIANGTGWWAGLRAIRGAAEFGALSKGYGDWRLKLMEAAARLAGGAFGPEIQEDIDKCTRLDWAELWAMAEDLGVFQYRERRTLLGDDELDELRRKAHTFYRAAKPDSLGTTNNTFAIIYVIARMMAHSGLIGSIWSILPADRSGGGRPVYLIPEGPKAMPFVRRRFAETEIPPALVKVLTNYEPIIQGPPKSSV